ncbi:MAG: CRISPR-associated endonuclease Cas3'' [Thermoprotei archaeon]
MNRTQNECAIEGQPLAYYEEKPDLIICVPLDKHLHHTMKASSILFRDRLETLNMFLRKNKYVHSVKDLAETAGLLHDLGKVSKYYYSKFRSSKTNKLSFVLHEHIPALILADIALRSNDECEKYLFKLLARVIARHHTAMRDRHPQILLNTLSYAKSRSRTWNIRLELENAVKEFLNSHDEVIDLLDRLANICSRNEFCIHVIDKIKKHLQQAIKASDISRLINQGLQITARAVDRDPVNEYKLLVGLTGVLIVTDNVIAYYERRVSDDETTYSYISHWLRELNIHGQTLERILLHKPHYLLNKH